MWKGGRGASGTSATAAGTSGSCSGGSASGSGTAGCSTNGTGGSVPRRDPRTPSSGYEQVEVPPPVQLNLVVPFYFKSKEMLSCNHYDSNNEHAYLSNDPIRRLNGFQ